AVLLLVSLLPLALVGAGSQIVFSDLLEEKTLELHRSVVETHARSIDLYLVERLRALDVVARSHRLEELSSPPVLKQLLNTINDSYGMSFVDLGIISEDGRHLAYVGPYALQDKNYANESWFQAVMSENTHVSDVFLGFRGIPHCIIAVKRSEENTSWILRATINSIEFDKLVRPGLIGRTGDAFIVNAAGAYQTPPKSGNIMEPSMVKFAQPHSGVRQSRLSEDGSPMLRATTWINNGRWMLVVQQNENEIQAPVRNAMLNGALVILLAVGLVVGTTILATRHLTRQIDRANAQRDELSKDLLRSAKLASLGEMSSGLAHEINNPLAIISAEHTNIEDLLGEIDMNTQVKAELLESVERCKRQVKRCGNITCKMLQFGHKTDTKLQPTDIEPKLQEVLTLMQKQAQIKNIDLALAINQNSFLPRVLIDPSEFEQVIVNLINNSMHAIKDKGTITISVKRLERNIAVTVTDDGTGIAPDVVDKIFQPFFTTKPPGEGTGLGLSVCYGMVRGWGGTIKASSELGKGTDMTIHLPLSTDDHHDHESIDCVTG
ncbi:MAG: ATP-binding protein, partial [Candidatus Latescibacterota bacterium]